MVRSRDLVASVLPTTDALYGSILSHGAEALLHRHRLALAEDAHLLTRAAAASTAGGVASCVQDRRLVHVRRSLARRLRWETVGEIGDRFGFRSDAHLSPAFRKSFGIAPRDVPSLFGPDASPVIATDRPLISDRLAEQG